MHIGAVAAMLFRHHDNKTLQELLKRLDKDSLIGTLVFSDPATGTCIHQLNRPFTWSSKKCNFLNGTKSKTFLKIFFFVIIFLLHHHHQLFPHHHPIIIFFFFIIIIIIIIIINIKFFFASPCRFMVGNLLETHRC